MKQIDLIEKICDECIHEGESVLKTEWLDDNMGGDFFVLNPKSYVELESFKKWKSNCNVLLNLLGDMASPWSESFINAKNNLTTNASSMLGALKSMKDTIAKGYLIRVENLVFAEAFSNLIEQSEYLFDEKYYLAAGVIARAVLEEKLRNLCYSVKINFSKTMPTLSDYNTELYKAKFYDKIEFKNVDHLISIGNTAAHNQPVKQTEIAKLIAGVKEVLIKYK